MVRETRTKADNLNDKFKEMKKILNHKKEIIISLITGIFLFYLQPFLNFLGNLFVKTFVSLSDNFSNNYYSSIAKNDTTVFSDWNSLLLNFLFAIIFVSFVFYLFYNKRKMQMSVDETILDILDSKSRLTKIVEIKNTDEQQTAEKLLSRLPELETRANKLKLNVYKRDNKIIFISITTIFLIVLLFTNYAKMNSISNQNLNFRNDIVKITPYVENSTINRLYSDWARIENSYSFNKVKFQLDSIKLVYKIK